MAWSVEFQSQALEDLQRLDKPVPRQILRYLRERIEGEEEPRRFGKALTGSKVGLWRYRIGDYRVICSIEDARLVVLVVHAGHRKSVYHADPPLSSQPKGSSPMPIAITIRHERPEDLPAIHALNAAAFGQPAEADLIDRLRATGALTLSLVAEEAGEVVGQRRLTRVNKGIMHLYATCRQGTFVLIGLTPLPGLASERTQSACG